MHERPAIAAVIAERECQVEQVGWSLNHDDDHANGELALAATYCAAPTEIRCEMEVLVAMRMV